MPDLANQVRKSGEIQNISNAVILFVIALKRHFHSQYLFNLAKLFCYVGPMNQVQDGKPTTTLNLTWYMRMSKTIRIHKNTTWSEG